MNAEPARLLSVGLGPATTPSPGQRKHPIPWVAGGVGRCDSNLHETAQDTQSLSAALLASKILYHSGVEMA